MIPIIHEKRLVMVKTESSLHHKVSALVIFYQLTAFDWSNYPCWHKNGPGNGLLDKAPVKNGLLVAENLMCQPGGLLMAKRCQHQFCFTINKSHWLFSVGDNEETWCQSGRTLANIWFNKLPSVYPLRLSYCFMESKQFYRLQKRLMNWFPFLRSVQLYNCQKHVQSQNPPKLICTSILIYYNKILLIWVTLISWILQDLESWSSI